MSTLRDKLAADLMSTGWQMLAMHYRRGTLLLVDPAHDLVEVALAVAENRTAEVQVWIDAGHIAHPTPQQAAHWAKEDAADDVFRFVIVQPFVLAQRSTH